MSERLNPLYAKYPPSNACSCAVCRNYCLRPGWWLVAEARSAMDAGYAGRMMLEFSPDFSVAILSPAFRGNEGFFALGEYAFAGCTFLETGRCALFGKAFRPIECGFCHHERVGLGLRCHRDIGRDWDTAKGRRLVARWLADRNLELPATVREATRRDITRRLPAREKTIGAP
jgi:hypothetical protein